MKLRAVILVCVLYLIAIFNCSALNSTLNGHCPNVKNPLGSVRKRRHLAFPTGSSAGVITSVVKTFMTHVPSGWYTVVELELTFKLPDATVISASKRRKLHHRQKKEIWETLQNALEQRNLNGRSCIIRAVCEAKMNLAPKGGSLVHDILRAMFTFHSEEQDFVKEMDDTYAEILEPNLCEKAMECPISIVGLVLDLNKQRFIL